MMEIIIILIILLFSAVIHEVCHGVMAYRLGDDTAKIAGRLTLNPIPHIDPFGSIILPLMFFAPSLLYFLQTGTFLPPRMMLGMAKPVPVNYFNLKKPKRDMALVSLAGPGSNLLLAICFALPIRLGQVAPGTGSFEFLLLATAVNLSLAIFNLLPVPPLDGFKIFASLFPEEQANRLLEFERFGFFILILLLLSGMLPIVVFPIFRFISALILGFPIG